MPAKPLSILNLPLSIHEKTIEDTLNQQLPELLYEDREAADDGLLLVAKKMGDIILKLKEGSILYSIPLKIWVKKLTMLSDVEVEAAIQVQMRTDYRFSAVDILETQTSLTDYNWLEKPTASLGGLNLSVKAIADIIINRTKSKLTESIDQQIQEKFQLRTLLAQAWVKGEQAFPLYPTYEVELLLQPQRLGILPVRVVGDQLHTQLRIEALPIVYTQDIEPPKKLADFPAIFQIMDSEESFEISADGKISLATLEKIAQQQMTGQKISISRYDLIIKKLTLTGYDHSIMVFVDFAGAYDGWAQVKGIPKYNATTQVLYFEDLEYVLDKSNPLLSGLGWLFKRSFEQKLKDALTVSLKAPLQQLRVQAKGQLDRLSFHSTLRLSGDLSHIEIIDARYESKIIHLQLYLSGALRLVDQRSSLA